MNVETLALVELRDVWPREFAKTGILHCATVYRVRRSQFIEACLNTNLSMLR